MNFNEYYEQISKIPEAEGLLFDQAVFWVHPEILPLAVVSLNGLKDKIVKICSSLWCKCSGKIKFGKSIGLYETYRFIWVAQRTHRYVL